MTTVFISYSTRNHHFAELAGLKLAEEGILLWRDQGQLRAGSDWRMGIERGIAESMAVLVALSGDSVDSPYVTFEWAYALGKGKTVVPLRLEPCKLHPRLETVQYLDFSVPGALPWDLLVERIHEIEAEATSQEDWDVANALPSPVSNPALVKSILAYLNQRGYQMVSYDRLRRRIDSGLTDETLDQLVTSNPSIFRQAMLKDAKRGLAKRVP